LTGPLNGVRVIAVEQYGAGPFGTMQLADLGAEVIKVEDPRAGGDVSRSVPPYAKDGDSLFFESFNRGKRSIALDLADPAGHEVFERLVTTADAVFSNLRGDQPAKLRLRYGDLAAANPRIVCVSLSGFGQTGPRHRQGAYDYSLQGLAGWQSITGGPDDPPTKSGLSLVDLCGGYVAALALTSGICQARTTGIGCDVDLSLFEVALAQLTYIGVWAASRDYKPIRRVDSAHQSVVPFQNFKAADGYLVIACPKESLWQRFAVAIGRASWIDDPRFATFADRARNREVLVSMTNNELGKRSCAEWCAIFEQAGVPASPVNTVQEALADAQVAARDALATVDHPTLGPVVHVRSPLRTLGERAPQRGPFYGEDSRALLAEVGYADDEISDLLDRGVSVEPDRRVETAQ
jgi:crotonobetainyl-CoA:carnitine CoA-transferase CaiB-like acyl-CoA transferase